MVCAGKDFTSYIEVQDPTPLQPLRKGDMHPSATRDVELGGDGTACVMEGVKIRPSDAVGG